MADLVYDAFDLADKYRNPVLILGDAQIGQLMEPVEFHKKQKKDLPPKDWALTGAEGRKRNIVKSFYPIKGQLEEFNAHLQRKYRTIEEHEVRYESIDTDDADVVLIAYGTSARICKEVIRKSSQLECNVGLIRPITLWPFPKECIRTVSEKVQCILTVEMSAGQMVEDVRLAVEGRCPVHFYGRTGGGVPTSLEVMKKLTDIISDSRSVSVASH